MVASVTPTTDIRRAREPGRDAMKAIVQTAYGSAEVLQLRDIDKPTVQDDDVLVRVDAAARQERDAASAR
jgi:D-arabinose 1-dehydrogenase-like Zn-dependent alcohol dehydrogenase